PCHSALAVSCGLPCARTDRPIHDGGLMRYGCGRIARCFPRQARYISLVDRPNAWRSDSMKRMWPDELNFVLDDAEDVVLDLPAVTSDDGVGGEATHRQALKVRITQQDYERIWPLAETRYRLDGKFSGKAITLIVNNPHYHSWHPADGG